MHFHTGRRYYFPIFSVLVQNLQKGPRVPRYCCRALVAKKTACNNAHGFRNLTAKLSQNTKARQIGFTVYRPRPHAIPGCSSTFACRTNAFKTPVFVVCCIFIVYNNVSVIFDILCFSVKKLYSNVLYCKGSLKMH